MIAIRRIELVLIVPILGGRSPPGDCKRETGTGERANQIDQAVARAPSRAGPLPLVKLRYTSLPMEVIMTPLDIRPPILDALAGRHPVVALESTLISHGLPWPTNLETA